MNMFNDYSIKKIMFQQITYVLILSVFVLCIVIDWFFSYNPLNPASRRVPQLIRLFVFINMLIYTFLYLPRTKLLKQPISICMLLWLFILFFNVLMLPDPNMYYLLILMRYSFWIIAFFCFYTMAFNNVIVLKNLSKITMLIAFISSSRVILWYFTGVWIGDESTFSVASNIANYSYQLLWFVPILLLSKQKSVVHIITLSITIIAILISLKRGTFVCLVTSGLAYAFIEVIEKKVSFKRVLACLILFSVFLILFVCKEFELVLSNWADLIDPNKSAGSGRGEFYSIIITHWFHGDLYNKLFGNGFYAVPDLLGYFWKAKIFAHSDWLESLYDYGILGIIIFSLLHISIVNRIYRYSKVNGEYLSSLVMGYLIFSLACIFSMVTIEANTAWFSLLIGFSFGEADNINRNSFV